jgi:hypothetical protein
MGGKNTIIYKRWAQSLMNQDYSLSKKPELLFVFIRLKNYKKVSNFDKLPQVASNSPMKLQRRNV